MKYTFLGIVCIVMLIGLDCYGQSADSTVIGGDLSKKLTDKYINSVGDRSADYQKQMALQTDKYLDGLKQQEQSLQKTLAKKNPEAATKIFAGSTEKYDKLKSDLSSNAETVTKTCGKYVGGIDSALTSLKFLDKQDVITGKLTGQATQIKAAMSKITSLQTQFTKTDNVEEFLRQRKEYLQQQLSSYNLPGLQQYKQKIAYYGQEMDDLRDAWQDPSKAEAKALKILNKIPAFQEFMKKNSIIGQLFNLPDDYGTTGTAGLQTKDDVQKMMQQSMSMMGPGGSQTAQQNIGDAQSALSGLRSKINQGSSDLAMPDGQGNKQHTKSIFKRLEYGVNVQSTKSNIFFPAQSVFAGTAGYKLNDKSVIGIGFGYTMGWGPDLQHIHITNQGIGLRSFLDVQLKGGIYASGGYELNYNKPFNPITQISMGNLWQRSGLIGLSKIISMKGSFAKKTKLQLLWDVLSYNQRPKTQPFIFRVGYSF